VAEKVVGSSPTVDGQVEAVGEATPQESGGGLAHGDLRAKKRARRECESGIETLRPTFCYV
jgi:hypothetical protein